MREIEFRGWCEYKKKWVYGYLCKSGDGFAIAQNITHIDGQDYTVECDDVIPETVGQYTGVKDKNGTKIYEGDICRMKWSDFLRKEYDEDGEIQFKDGAFGISLESQAYALYDCIGDDIEVVDNIHEKQSEG